MDKKGVVRTVLAVVLTVMSADAAGHGPADHRRTGLTGCDHNH